LAASLLLVLAAGAQAKVGVHLLADAVDDAESLDITEVAWSSDGANLTVWVTFDGTETPPGAALRGVFVLGDPGAVEPAEWYQFTLANSSKAFAAHGTPREVQVLSSSWNGSVASLVFERPDPAQGSCAFVVVESGILGAGGFDRLDVAPRGFASMDAAWPVDACPPEDAPAASADEKGSPGVDLALLAWAFAFALLLRRR
jgi:hypothetical protein